MLLENTIRAARLQANEIWLLCYRKLIWITGRGSERPRWSADFRSDPASEPPFTPAAIIAHSILCISAGERPFAAGSLIAPMPESDRRLSSPFLHRRLATPIASLVTPLVPPAVAVRERPKMR